MDYAAVEYTLRPGNNPDPARFSDLDMPAMLEAGNEHPTTSSGSTPIPASA